MTTIRSRHFKISIHALREEGDLCAAHVAMQARLISIHALREEGDSLSQILMTTQMSISIHALREEGDMTH